MVVGRAETVKATAIEPQGCMKRFLLPLYNGGYHLARRGARLAGALARGRIERCPACGRVGPLLYEPRIIPLELVRRWGLSPRLTEAFARKESLACVWCGAALRARRLAQVLLETYPTNPPPRAIVEWADRPEIRSLRVAEINRVEGLHTALARLPGLIYSEFLAGSAPGSIVEGIRREDLTRLSYPDASFDLVLTSETLEHVPDLDRALAEIRRVLVPGGCHIFTIPWRPDVPNTFARSVIESGNIVHRVTPIHHPGGDVGYPVFTEFGQDLPDLLRQAGFATEVRFGPATEDDVAQVFACRKPAS